MSSFADYSDETTVEQLDAALRAVPVDGVAHYLAGAFARRIESPAIVRAIRTLLWPQMGISVPTLATVDGTADAARARDVYDCPRGMIFWLDIEPDEFRADPFGWARAADQWCIDVWAAGFVPGVYGTDATVAACANHADRIWRAKPGMCDPAGPGLAADFFDGSRAVQCTAGTFAGLPMDISYAEFTLGGTMTPDQEALVVAAAASLTTSGEPGSESLNDEISQTYYGRSPGFQAVMQAIANASPATAANTQLVADVADLKAAVGRIEAALKTA